MADTQQRQTYGKTAEKQGKSKLVSGGSLAMIKGGPASPTGPTGSSRSYPKGSVKMSTNWNPANMKASTYGVNGI